MRVRKRMRRVAREEWPVLIKDHHPAYIAYDKFLENLRRLDANRVMRPNEDQSESGPAREGWSCPDLADRFDCLDQVDALVSNSMGDT